MNIKNIPFFSNIALITVWLFLSGCAKEEPKELAAVTTIEITQVTRDTAQGGGEITDDGGAAITRRGVVWSAAENPSMNNKDGSTTDGAGTGRFKSDITRLSPGTTYFVRAYVESAAGMAYGNQVSFTTLLEDDGKVGSLTDVDGNIYQTVFIGGREWMAENLVVTRYNDGEIIPTGLDDNHWFTTTSGAYSVYPHSGIDDMDSHSEVLAAYGALYNWYAVDTGRLCPVDWEVPSDEDWKSLEGHADTMYGTGHVEWDTIQWRGHDAGQRLRATYDFGFSLKSIEEALPVRGTDIFGFTALPGGFRNFIGPFFDHGNYGYWWSSTEENEYLAWMRSMGVISLIRRDAPGKTNGFSVRCIRETTDSN
jgi:uncharacterized protein (TIGR02145 family)